MNSLEFIEKFIKHAEEEIEYFKKRIEEDLNYPSLKQCHELELESAIKSNETLHQIKDILEAWEVVKDKITTIGYYDTQEDFEEDTNEHKALCLVSNLKFQNSNDEDEWFIPLNEKETITLEKALEVKDE